MSTDTIKLIFTYLVVLVVVIGGGVILLTAPVLDELIKGAIIGFIGSALTFTFGAEVQTRTARQQERALLTSPQTTTTTTATYTGGSGTLTTEPSEPATETES